MYPLLKVSHSHFFLINFLDGFLIKTRDAQGKRIRKGGHPITAKLTGDGQTRTDLIDNKDGTYLMRFKPNHEVTYDFEVRYSDTEITGSPFTARIHESKKEIVSGEKKNRDVDFLKGKEK